MISKISIGSGIGGCLNYLMDEKKQFVVLDAKGLSYDKKEAKEQFRKWASVNAELKKNVLHIPLAFSPEDKQKLNEDPGLKSKVVDRYIQLMSKKGYAIDKTQFIVIEHHDTKHPHIHLVFNRVNENAKTIKDGYIAFNSKKICQQITKEFGLTEATSKSKKISEEKLHGKEKLKQEIFTELTKAQTKNKYLSIENIKDTLEKKSIELKLIVDDNGKIFGSYYIKKIGTSEIKIKTSSIDKEYTLSKLVIQHQLHNLRKSLQDEYLQRHKIKTVVKDLDYEYTRYAKDQSRMMDDLTTIMSLGLLKKSKPVSKIKSPFANNEELKERREKTRSVIGNMIQTAIQQSDTFESFKLMMAEQKIKITSLNREKKILVASGDTYFISTELNPQFTYDFLHLNFENKQEDLRETLIDALKNLMPKISDLKDLKKGLLPYGITLNQVNSISDSGSPVMRLSFAIGKAEFKRNDLTRELNSWISSLISGPLTDPNAVQSAEDEINAMIKQAVVDEMEKITTQDELKAALFEKHGIDIIFKYDSANNLVGCRFNLNEHTVKGSDIGLAAKAIVKRLPQKGTDQSDQKPGLRH